MGVRTVWVVLTDLVNEFTLLFKKLLQLILGLGLYDQELLAFLVKVSRELKLVLFIAICACIEMVFLPYDASQILQYPT